MNKELEQLTLDAGNLIELISKHEKAEVALKIIKESVDRYLVDSKPVFRLKTIAELLS